MESVADGEARSLRRSGATTTLQLDRWPDKGQPRVGAAAMPPGESASVPLARGMLEGRTILVSRPEEIPGRARTEAGKERVSEVGAAVACWLASLWPTG